MAGLLETGREPLGLFFNSKSRSKMFAHRAACSLLDAVAHLHGRDIQRLYPSLHLCEPLLNDNQRIVDRSEGVFAYSNGSRMNTPRTDDYRKATDKANEPKNQ